MPVLLHQRMMERAMRFELTTSTLARLRSTPELRPHKNSTPVSQHHQERGPQERSYQTRTPKSTETFLCFTPSTNLRSSNNNGITPKSVYYLADSGKIAPKELGLRRQTIYLRAFKGQAMNQMMVRNHGVHSYGTHYRWSGCT